VTLLTYEEAAEADWRKATGPEFWVDIVQSSVASQVITVLFADGDSEIVQPDDVFYLEDGTHLSVKELTVPTVKLALPQSSIGVNRLFVQPD
jgi:hypothetical protein